MDARRLQYLSRMGVDVWRRRNVQATTSGAAEAEAVNQTPVADAVLSSPSAVGLVAEQSLAPSAEAPPFVAHWVIYEGCAVVAGTPARLIDDVVRAFAGKLQGPLRSEQLQGVRDLAERLSNHAGVTLIFGEDVARALTGDFVPHDPQTLGAGWFVCAHEPHLYADDPLAKRPLWRALCRLQAAGDELADQAAGA